MKVYRLSVREKNPSRPIDVLSALEVQIQMHNNILTVPSAFDLLRAIATEFSESVIAYLHCALASCGAVYCDRSCLWVCDSGRVGSGRAVSEPYYSQRARSICVSLSAIFILLRFYAD